MSSIVVTGTDTAVGKTVFSAALVAAFGAKYWKPVQSGLDEATDSQIVGTLGRVPPDRLIPELYRLKTPASPHLSAQIDGVKLERARFVLPVTSGPLVVEGAGGLLVPLVDDLLYADVFADWQCPTVLCARTELGTINHTLLSIEAMRARSIPIAGIAFMGIHREDTESVICRLGNVPRLGRLPFVVPLTPDSLADAFRRNFDLNFLARLLND